MKVCVVQPPYSTDYSRSDALFQWQMDTFDRMDESMDLIVFPEYATVPALPGSKANMEASYRKYNQPLMEKAAETALRCNAVVMINGPYMTPTGLRNTTVVYDRDGKEAGCYFKQHLVPSEMYGYQLDKDYTFEHSQPTILQIDGVRYAFLICYDAYFYEAWPNIARYDPDVIVACSHQRSDSHHALEIMHQFLAYNTNAYVVRSSVSMGEGSDFGGTSMIITPEGKTLVNMMSETGFACAEIDPHKRYLKPAGFGNPPDAHHHYIDVGRRPWKYRPAGSAICLPDEWMPYPRVCAHRGFNSVAPENSLPAFGAAIALGAQEIEFDLWATKDGEVVSIHDSTLDRISDGTGKVWEYTYEELLKLDFGAKHTDRLKNLKIVTFEEILRKFACHAVMNIHVKSIGTDPLPESHLLKIIGLIRKYDCEKYCYFMANSQAVLQQLQTLAPDIPRCAGVSSVTDDLVTKALATGSERIQIKLEILQTYGEEYVKEMIRKAHESGIKVNYFFSDDPKQTEYLFSLGVDTVLTNDYYQNALVLK